MYKSLSFRIRGPMRSKYGFAGNPPFEAKSGMSANVDIITSEKKDVLLIPNKSIKHNSQGQALVNV